MKGSIIMFNLFSTPATMTIDDAVDRSVIVTTVCVDGFNSLREFGRFSTDEIKVMVFRTPAEEDIRIGQAVHSSFATAVTERDNILSGVGTANSRISRNTAAVWVNPRRYRRNLHDVALFIGIRAWVSAHVYGGCSQIVNDLTIEILHERCRVDINRMAAILKEVYKRDLNDCLAYVKTIKKRLKNASPNSRTRSAQTEPKKRYTFEETVVTDNDFRFNDEFVNRLEPEDDMDEDDYYYRPHHRNNSNDQQQPVRNGHKKAAQKNAPPKSKNSSRNQHPKKATANP